MNPEVTPVGLDHQAYLGNTIEEIAAEKAGVVKAEGFAVLAQQEPAAAQVLGCGPCRPTPSPPPTPP